jgi:AraC family transcriptional regulator
MSAVSAPAHRAVGGSLLESVVVGAEHARIEMLRRGSAGRIAWQFRNPSPTALWFRAGTRRLRLDVDGIRFDAAVSVGGPLCFFPAGANIAGEFTVDPVTDYAVVFFDPLLAQRHAGMLPRKPLVGVPGGAAERGLSDLARYGSQPDETLQLSAEGWTLQTLAQIARQGAPSRPAPAEPGLPDPSLAQVERYVSEHLSEPITVDQLAAVAGFSRRHFMRAFSQRTGQSPMRYVYSARLEEAGRRLTVTDEPVTAIAAACGFSHSQHLDSAFRRKTGMTPSQFRAAS